MKVLFLLSLTVYFLTCVRGHSSSRASEGEDNANCSGSEAEGLFDGEGVGSSSPDGSGSGHYTTTGNCFSYSTTYFSPSVGPGSIFFSSAVFSASSFASSLEGGDPYYLDFSGQPRQGVFSFFA